MYEVVVSFTVENDHREAFRDAAVKARQRVLDTEPGTERFDVLADEWNPSRFYILEAYADEQAFDRHVTADPAKEFLTEVQRYTAGPDFILRGTTLH
ncbi:antibiotic biosynthesis monooxygenase [Streptomyces sp. NPDC050264]|uniref:putative quinol monooxygenase n=1 Tax=Streptomyces sp. NPDC050264 TaxID=3155038 RepID=UPI0034128AA6